MAWLFAQERTSDSGTLKQIMTLRSKPLGIVRQTRTAPPRKRTPASDTAKGLTRRESSAGSASASVILVAFSLSLGLVEAASASTPEATAWQMEVRNACVKTI